MQDDDDEFLMREFDFDRGVRNPFAALWTPEDRAAFLRDSAAASEKNWNSYVQEAFDALASALFAHQVLVGGETPRRAAVRSAGLHPAERGTRLARRLSSLRRERERVSSSEPDAGGQRGAAWIEQMGRLLTEADEVRKALEDEVRSHLENGGLTPGEIERRTAEAARLWRAA